MRVLLIVRRRDPALELDVTAQVELVGDIVQISLSLGLASEMLLPVPFLQKLLREGIAVGPALRIKAGAGIAVPVPSAADGGAGLEHSHLETELAQLVELVEPGNASANDDRVEIHACLCGSSVGNRWQAVHAVIPHPNNPSNHPRRSNRVLSESRAAADCIARLSAPSVAASRSCECPAAVKISRSSHDGDRTGTETSVIP